VHQLIAAIDAGDTDLIRGLLEAGTNVNTPDDKQRTALHVVVVGGGGGGSGCGGE
jgi:ankyrin repeat protein